MLRRRNRRRHLLQTSICELLGIRFPILQGALEGVGYAAGEVKDFFVSIGGSFGDFFGDVGDALDPTGW